VAIGRKNWLFAGNDAAAENRARLRSLIASCERHALDPQRYLTSVLAKIGTLKIRRGGTPAEQFAQFLPDLWKREDGPIRWPTTDPRTPAPRRFRYTAVGGADTSR
jgi:hypothetical protein